MALNPRHASFARVPSEVRPTPTPFQAEAEAALAGFRAVRDELQRQVRRGDLTPKVARQRAAEAVETLRRDLAGRSEQFRTAPRVFQERLMLAAEARRAARASSSAEALQRETVQLLRQTLVEQQLTNRAAEFEGRTFVRPITGGQPAPTLDSLLAFHAQAEHAGDEAAREWARRRLEALRSHLIDPEDHRRIDAATDRPDRVNPRTVGRYVETLREAVPEALETFVTEALASHDASACTAAFVLAREAPEGLAARWVRAVLEGLKEFPDTALEHLRAQEAELLAAETAAARAEAERIAAIAAAEARFDSLEAPDPREVERLSRIASLPVAAPGEPIGLALTRRGLDPQEIQALPNRNDPPEPE